MTLKQLEEFMRGMQENAELRVFTGGGKDFRELKITDWDEGEEGDLSIFVEEQ
jgi:hypothetical protein